MSKLRFKNGIAEPATPADGVVIYADASFNIYSKDENGLVTPLGVAVFGSDAQFAESLAQSENTTTTFQVKLDLVTTNLPAGNYKLEFSSECQKVATSNSMFAELAQDPAGLDTVLFELVKEPKDNTDWIPWGGIRILNLSGIQTFRIRFRTETNGNAARIRNVSIALSRFS